MSTGLIIIWSVLIGLVVAILAMHLGLALLAARKTVLWKSLLLLVGVSLLTTVVWIGIMSFVFIFLFVDPKASNLYGIFSVTLGLPLQLGNLDSLVKTLPRI